MEQRTRKNKKKLGKTGILTFVNQPKENGVKWKNWKVRHHSVMWKLKLGIYHVFSKSDKSAKYVYQYQSNSRVAEEIFLSWVETVGIWGIAMHSALLTRCNNLKSAFTKHNKLLFTTFRWNNTSQRERMNTENRKGESLEYFSNYCQEIMIGPIVVRFSDWPVATRKPM